jgi:hypothetical protein
LWACCLLNIILSDKIKVDKIDSACGMHGRTVRILMRINLEWEELNEWKEFNIDACIILK